MVKFVLIVILSLTCRISKTTNLNNNCLAEKTYQPIRLPEIVSVINELDFTEETAELLNEFLKFQTLDFDVF